VSDLPVDTKEQTERRPDTKTATSWRSTAP